MTEPESTQSIPEAEARASAPETDASAKAPSPEPEPWTPERVTEWNAYYDLYVTLGVLLLAFVASANKITHSSIWPQLQAGRMIAEKTAPVVTDLFSYTAEGRRWVNIPWLFECEPCTAPPSGLGPRSDRPDRPGRLCDPGRAVRRRRARGAQRSGPGRDRPGRPGHPPPGAGALVGRRLRDGGAGRGLQPGRLDPRWDRDPGPGRARDLGPAPARPGIARAAPGTINLGRRGAAFALVPLFLLWANLDDSFVVGLIVLAAAVAGLGLTRSRCGDAEALSWPAGLAVWTACAVACLVNPSFYRVYPAALEPIAQLFRPSAGVPTYDQLSYFGKAIWGDELGKGLGGHLVAYYLLFVGLGLGSFVLNRRHFSPSRFLMFAVAAVLWGALIRFSAAFAVVFAATVTLNGQEWYHDRFGTRGRLGRGWEVWSIGGRAVTIILVFTLMRQDPDGLGPVVRRGHLRLRLQPRRLRVRGGRLPEVGADPGPGPEHDHAPGRLADLAGLARAEDLLRQPPAPVPARGPAPVAGDPPRPQGRRGRELEAAPREVSDQRRHDPGGRCREHVPEADAESELDPVLRRRRHRHVRPRRRPGRRPRLLQGEPARPRGAGLSTLEAGAPDRAPPLADQLDG